MKRSILLIAVLFVSMLLIGCSENSVNSGNATVDNLNMQISVASKGMLDVVTQFQVIITAEGRETMIVPLVYEQGVVSGTIDNAPAGDAITFLVQGRDPTGLVIYSGSNTIPVFADRENQLLINLVPVVSMIKLSPRYYEIAVGELASLDVKVFNLGNLNQISFRLYSSNSAFDFEPDTAILSPRLLELGDNIIFFDTISFTPPFYSMAFANGGTENMVNDPSGDITLATLFFTPIIQEILPDTTTISIDSLTMYDTNGNLIPSNTVIRDQCLITITEF